MAKFAVILPAAGKSTRFGDPKQKKIYAELEGRAVWLRAVEPFLNHPEVAQIIVAISAEDQELFQRRYHASVAFLDLDIIEGGEERAETVARALERVKPEVDYVAIHDAARPCLTHELIHEVFAAAVKHGAALPALAVADTVKRADLDRFTTGTVPRGDLFLAQTPQVFRRDWLTEAFRRRSELGPGLTDDTQLVEAMGHRCAIVAGSPFNLKITTQDDLKLAGCVVQLQARSPHTESGHPFADEQQWVDLPRIKPSDLFGP